VVTNNKAEYQGELMHRFILSFVLAGVSTLAATAYADTATKVETQYMAEAKRWNILVDKLYALHKRHIDGKDINIVEKTGSYFRLKDFYKEQKFFDKKSGKLLSLIQWETKNPKNIHVIQVFFYDDSGRLIRDFGAAFRTQDHDDPMATEINLHAYPNGLHAFRQFNASDSITYERCDGEFQGRKVTISLGVVDLEEFRDEPNTIMTSPEYKACFSNIAQKAGKYLTPQ
jgi:hypothetical protein